MVFDGLFNNVMQYTFLSFRFNVYIVTPDEVCTHNTQKSEINGKISIIQHTATQTLIKQ